MATEAQLSTEDREFYGLVAQAAFCNPFSDRWVELSTMIAGTSRDAPVSETDRCMVQRVTDRFRKLEAAGKWNLRLYSGEDRYLMVSASLFEVLHRFLDQFDQLILDQLQAGESSCAVPFANDVLAALTR